WNRFPPFPSEAYHGQLVPSEASNDSGFAADPRIRTLAHIDRDRPEELLVTDVDSGRVIRSIPLLPGEKISRTEPHARNLVVLVRPVKTAESVRVFAFEALASDAPQAAPLIDVPARAFDCAGGDWPCVQLTTDGQLFLLKQKGTSVKRIEVGS